MVGYSYRRVPAVALARRLVEQGRIGEIRHVRAQYLQDWIVDPEFPLVWRLQRSAAGSGALGDIGAHIVDMAQYLVGDLLTGVSALTETFVRERPLPAKIDGSARRAGWRPPAAPRRGPSTSTTRPCSSAASPAARWRRSRPRGSRRAGRTRCASS